MEWVSLILGLAVLAAMGWGWYVACRFVASRPGKSHLWAYVMMLFLWPAGIPGTIAGHNIRKGKGSTPFAIPEMPPATRDEEAVS